LKKSLGKNQVNDISVSPVEQGTAARHDYNKNRNFDQNSNNLSKNYFDLKILLKGK